MMRLSPIPILVPLVILSLNSVQAHPQQVQEWSPLLKERWGDSDTWRIIIPRDLDMDPGRFAGLRAQNEIREGLTDPLIQDGVFQFQPAARKGVAVIVASYTTLGNIADTDLSPGWWNGVIEPKTLAMLDFLSWNPRFGSFMYIPSNSGTTRWRLEAGGDRWSDPMLIEHDGPLFSLAIWGQILSALNLTEGMKFRLAVMRGAKAGYGHISSRVGRRSRISTVGPTTSGPWRRRKVGLDGSARTT